MRVVELHRCFSAFCPVLCCVFCACYCVGTLSAAKLWSQATDGAERLQLIDVTDTSGIEFVHSHGGSGLGYIVEGMATGVVTFDYNADGWIDIYFLNGSALKGTVVADPLENALYRNNGDWTFTDVTEQAGVGDRGYALGGTAADYDGDGDQDLYINNFGANVLYRNNGDDTFTEATAMAGVANGEKVGAGVGFLDIDGDEDLDLYVANYVDFTYENHVPVVIDGKMFQAGPQYYQPVADTLYQNNGDGTFTDISKASGIASVAGPGMGLVSADFDDDGDVDIYVCNDGQPNYLFENNGQGKFAEVGLLYGAACDFTGKANSSMGVDCGDYDHDGLLDILVTNYQAEMPVLYRNLSQGLFEDATSKAQIPQSLYPHVNWGTAFADFDSDSSLDVFIACGHFDRIEDIDDRTAQKVRNYLLLGDGQTFRDVSSVAGSGLAAVQTSRGAAVEDFDNDGDLDLVVVNSNAAPTLIRNDTPFGGNHWIGIELSQAGTNSDAVGAIVRIPQPVPQMRVQMSGRGYQSHFGSRLHFGLGKYSGSVSAEVQWPDGTLEQFPLQLDVLQELRRGAGHKVTKQ